MKIKVGSELQEEIRLAYEARQSVLLKGETGVGKSESLEAAARSLDIKYTVRDLSLMEPTDLTGLPYRDGNRTRFAPPSFLPVEGTTGLLVFEELNRCDRLVRAPCLQLLSARTLNDYVLPAGWLPVAAINPSEEGYYVDELDKSLLARFAVLHVEADVREWLVWAEGAGVHPAVRRFIRATRKALVSQDSSPRAWAYASHILHAYEQDEYSRNALLALVAGLVGDTLAAAFLQTYTNAASTELPEAGVVLGAYSKIRARVRQLAKAGDVATLDALTHQVLLHLQERGVLTGARRSDLIKRNLSRFAADLPAELRRRVVEEHKWLARKRKRRGS